MLFCRFYNRVQFQESVRSKFRPECARVFQFDFQFSNATFTVVVVRRNQRVFKKIEYVVSALYQSVLQTLKVFAKICDTLLECIIKPFKPRLFRNAVLRMLVTFMYGLLQNAFNAP